jgi:hypothetical protein
LAHESGDAVDRDHAVHSMCVSAVDDREKSSALRQPREDHLDCVIAVDVYESDIL